MVSAVFHSPADASAEAMTVSVATPRPLARDPAHAPAAGPAASPAVPDRPPRRRIDWRSVWMRVLPPLLGLGLLWLVWTVATLKGGAFPTPGATWAEASRTRAWTGSAGTIATRIVRLLP